MVRHGSALARSQDSSSVSRCLRHRLLRAIRHLKFALRHRRSPVTTLLGYTIQNVQMQLADDSLDAIRIALREQLPRSSEVLIVRHCFVGATYTTTGL